MGLNNISLSPALIADLYETSLIELQPSLEKDEQSFKFLGKNEKSILILVSKDTVAFLEENELNFLSSVLGACKLSLADVAIVNINSIANNTSYTKFLSQLKSKTVLLFNIDTKRIDLPFNFPDFQLQQFDHCTYLSAPSLKEIEENKTLKTQLWNCLKNIFHL